VQLRLYFGDIGGVANIGLTGGQHGRPAGAASPARRAAGYLDTLGLAFTRPTHGRRCVLKNVPVRHPPAGGQRRMNCITRHKLACIPLFSLPSSSFPLPLQLNQRRRNYPILLPPDGRVRPPAKGCMRMRRCEYFAAPFHQTSGTNGISIPRTSFTFLAAAG